jgi:hypothetical protein
MSLLLNLNMKEARSHEILKSKNHLDYDVVELRVLWDYDSNPEGMIELGLSSHHEYLRIRFIGLSDFTVPTGDLLSAIAVGIFDTSNVPNAPAPIRFQHPKSKTVSDTGSLSFWAQTMILIEHVDGTSA